MIDWRKAIGKSITKDERRYLKQQAGYIAEKFLAPTIVNIGVFRGATLLCLHAGAPKANLVGVDIKSCPIKLGIQWRQATGDSTECHRDFDEDIHLLFIDGDHHYEYVLADLNNWASKVVSNGVVILHDCHPTQKSINKTPHLVEVNRAVEDWLGQSQDIWEEIDAPDSLRAFRRST